MNSRFDVLRYARVIDNLLLLLAFVALAWLAYHAGYRAGQAAR